MTDKEWEEGGWGHKILALRCSHWGHTRDRHLHARKSMENITMYPGLSARGGYILPFIATRVTVAQISIVRRLKYQNFKTDANDWLPNYINNCCISKLKLKISFYFILFSNSLFLWTEAALSKLIHQVGFLSRSGKQSLKLLNTSNI